MDVRHSGLTRRVAMTVKWAGALLILMLSTPRAEGGTLYSDRLMPFTNINVDLPEIGLFASFPVNSFGFPPGGEQYVPGTEVEFDGRVTMGNWTGTAAR